MKKFLSITITIAILAAGGLLLYKSYTSYGTYTSDKSNTTDTIDTTYPTDTSYPTDASDTTYLSYATDLQSSPAARYVNKRYGFSFDKPEGYTVGAMAEGEGEIILVQSDKTDTTYTSDTTDTTHKTEPSDTSDTTYAPDKSYSGFQIFISRLEQLLDSAGSNQDKPMELTPQFIRENLSGTAVNNPQAIILDGKAKGLMFDSNNEAFGGRSFEIWFVADLPNTSDRSDTSDKTYTSDTTYPYLLYQITSYADFAPKLQKIMGTWKFN